MKYCKDCKHFTDDKGYPECTVESGPFSGELSDTVACGSNYEPIQGLITQQEKPMTIRDLMNKLNSFPSDWEVVVMNYDEWVVNEVVRLDDKVCIKSKGR